MKFAVLFGRSGIVT